MNGPGDRAVSIVLHDVAPARWAGCERVLARVAAVARGAGTRVPVTLLVVPRMHGEPTPPEFIAWLRAQACCGHELALHGYTHRDEAAPASTLAGRLLRRWYTAGEGEFAALGRREAAGRIAQGQAWAHENGLEVTGFVPPAWLMSAAGWIAVERAGFRYTCTLDRVVKLPSRAALPARGLVFSTRSWWRRALSVAWNSALHAHQRGAPLLRLELHPSDCDHPAIERCWSRILGQALRDRRAVRLDDAAGLALKHGLAAMG